MPHKRQEGRYIMEKKRVLDAIELLASIGVINRNLAIEKVAKSEFIANCHGQSNFVEDDFYADKYLASTADLHGNYEEQAEQAMDLIYEGYHF